MSGPFEYINAINNKKHVEQIESDYNQFLTNRAFSYFIDTVAIAKQINMYGQIDNEMHFDYMYNAISKKSRFSKWHKPKQHPDVVNISQYFNIPMQRAYQYHDLFSEDQLSQIKQQLKDLKG